MKISSIMFELLRFEIAGTPLSDEIKNAITGDVLGSLYRLSKSHDLAHLAADALEKNGLFSEDSAAKNKFVQDRNMAVYRYEQMQYEYERICEVLERAEIDYIPLKGAVIRSLYPEPWMRTSCDIDILVREEDLEKTVKTLQAELKYQTDGKKAYHDISLYSENGVHLELHFNICETMENIDKLLSCVWDYAERQSENGHRFCLKTSFFIFHILAHMSYHFVSGGCGVRPLLDLWILKRKLGYDEREVERLCQECELLPFYHSVCQLSEVWFSGAKSDELSNEVADYILGAGVYGSSKNSVMSKTIKEGGRFQFIVRYLFLPYSAMARLYPVLIKHKWLLPICWVRRWFSRLFQGKAKKAAERIKLSRTQTDEELIKTKDMFEKLGL